MTPALAELEAREKVLYSRFAKLPNGPERERGFRKWLTVRNQISQLIYGDKDDG